MLNFNIIKLGFLAILTMEVNTDFWSNDHVKISYIFIHFWEILNSVIFYLMCDYTIIFADIVQENSNVKSSKKIKLYYRFYMYFRFQLLVNAKENINVKSSKKIKLWVLYFRFQLLVNVKVLQLYFVFYSKRWNIEKKICHCEQEPEKFEARIRNRKARTQEQKLENWKPEEYRKARSPQQEPGS